MDRSSKQTVFTVRGCAAQACLKRKAMSTMQAGTLLHTLEYGSNMLVSVSSSMPQSESLKSRASHLRDAGGEFVTITRVCSSLFTRDSTR